MKKKRIKSKKIKEWENEKKKRIKSKKIIEWENVKKKKIKSKRIIEWENEKKKRIKSKRIIEWEKLYNIFKQKKGQILSENDCFVSVYFQHSFSTVSA